MGHLLFHLLDFLQERQSVFHEVFSGHILLMMKIRLTMMMRLMKRMIDGDDDDDDDDDDEDDDDDDDDGHKQLSACLKE